jgi:hypothetical protein
MGGGVGGREGGGREKAGGVQRIIYTTVVQLYTILYCVLGDKPLPRF